MLLARGPSPLWHPRPRAHCGAFAAGLLPLAPARAPVWPPSPPKPRQVSPGRVAEGSGANRLADQARQRAAEAGCANRGSFRRGHSYAQPLAQWAPLAHGQHPRGQAGPFALAAAPTARCAPPLDAPFPSAAPPRLTAGSTRAPLSQREAKAQGAQRYARGVILAPVSLNSGHD